MKKRFILLILMLLSFSFVDAQELCSSKGYTVLSINGILTNKTEAILNKNVLEYKLSSLKLSEPITVDYVYNPTHALGLGDLVDVSRQGLLNIGSDYDLTEIIEDASNKVKTQKVLVVGHSQGNFYANSFYDKVADMEGGIPSNSIGVYGVASPDKRVAGGGSYITSDTDKVIAWFVDKVKTILEPNTHIELSKEDGLGHDFANVYLKYRSKEIIGGIKSSLNKLQTNDIQGSDDPCISPIKVSLMHKIKSIIIDSTDFTLNGVFDFSLKLMSVSENIFGRIVNVLGNIGGSGLALVYNPENQPINTEASDGNSPTDDANVLNENNSNENSPSDATIQNNESDQDVISPENSDQSLQTEGVSNEETVILDGGSSGGHSSSDDTKTDTNTGGETVDTGSEQEGDTNVVEDNFGIDCSSFLETDLDGDGVSDHNQKDLIISESKELLAGEYCFHNLKIINNSTLLLKSNSSLEYPGVKINVENIEIEDGSLLSSVGQGYPMQSGPGYNNDSSIGSTHGGQGYPNKDASTIYGDALNPTTLGSGGYYSAGGGAIWLNVLDTFNNNGQVSSDAGNASSSGGSIYVNTKKLMGGGKFSANGGILFAAGFFQGPGGGGRVAIYYKESSYNGEVEAKGGCGRYDGYSNTCAENGTAILIDTTNNDYHIQSSWKFENKNSPFNVNNIFISKNATVNFEDDINLIAKNIEIDDSSIVSFGDGNILEIGDMILSNQSKIILSGSDNMVIENLDIKNNSFVTTNDEKVLKISTKNLSISSDSYISADNKGYIDGPGSPKTDYGGASYGGIGFAENESSLYGDPNEPIDFGSGRQNTNFRGGGAINLLVSGSFINDGTVSAVGSQNSSGGSIYVEVGDLSGSGTFNASGGGPYCPNSCFGPGGGGRVAIYYDSSSFDIANIKAKGVVANYGLVSNDGTIIFANIKDKKISSNDNPPEEVVDELSSDKFILSFSFKNLSTEVIGTIDNETHKINLSVPYSTDVSNLIPTISISEKANISPGNLESKDFTNPVDYTVTAQDGSTIIYNVVVAVLPNSNPDPDQQPDPEPLVVLSISDYKFNDVSSDITINPLVNNLNILINTNKNVNWMSVKIENPDDSSVYKIFYSDTKDCIDGTSTCLKTWNGSLSGQNTLLKNGVYKVKVHVKDLLGKEWYDYLPSVITVIGQSI